jgi:hypothetical protein
MEIQDCFIKEPQLLCFGSGELVCSKFLEFVAPILEGTDIP